MANLRYEESPQNWIPVLTVKIIPARTQDPELLDFTWEIINYTKSEIKFQLDFENPLYVSFEEEPDILEISFHDEDLFISENGIKI